MGPLRIRQCNLCKVSGKQELKRTASARSWKREQVTKSLQFSSKCTVKAVAVSKIKAAAFQDQVEVSQLFTYCIDIGSREGEQPPFSRIVRGATHQTQAKL